MLLLRVSEHAYGSHCNKLKPAFCFTAKILPKIENEVILDASITRSEKNDCKNCQIAIFGFHL